MTGLVNYAKEPHSVELRELPAPDIGEEDVLFSVEPFDEIHSGQIVKGVLKP